MEGRRWRFLQPVLAEPQKRLSCRLVKTVHPKVQELSRTERTAYVTWNESVLEYTKTEPTTMAHLKSLLCLL